MWLGLSPSGDTQLEGSPVDAAILGVLLVAAIVVLIRRKRRVWVLMRSNWPILIYFLYCLVSVAWSHHPDVSFKRWIKSLGDPVMVLVIVTDPRPVAAIRHLVSRIGFLLFPTSLLFIRYFGELGRGYTDFGEPVNFGVTTNKNSLGLVVLVISLVVLWNVRRLWTNKHEPNRGRHLLAQGSLLGFGVILFWMANCSTGKACFVLGAFMMVVSNLRAINTRPARVHVLIFAILLAAGATLFLGGQGDVAEALGRQSSMSGRTDIWEAVIPTVPNALVGAGYESFWISSSAENFHQRLLEKGWYPPVVADTTEAHDGYVEVFLNLGGIGVCLLVLLLIAGYRRAFKAFRRDPELGGLLLAFVAVGVVYSVTEAGFRMLNPAWIFLLLAIIAASGVTTGLLGGRKVGLRRPLSAKPTDIPTYRIESAVRSAADRISAFETYNTNTLAQPWFWGGRCFARRTS
jgi:O-antigen ligase